MSREPFIVALTRRLCTLTISDDGVHVHSAWLLDVYVTHADAGRAAQGGMGGRRVPRGVGGACVRGHGGEGGGVCALEEGPVEVFGEGRHGVQLLAQLEGGGVELRVPSEGCPCGKQWVHVPWGSDHPQ